MFRIALLLFLFLTQATLHLHASGNDTINRLDKSGKRIGFWVLTNENKPTTISSSTKRKEGHYINGRKSGAWVFYYQDAKTVRLIGEFNDNRPHGAYFRFDKKGEIIQASTVEKAFDIKQYYETYNPVFACRLMFSNHETVAGQVFFKPKVFSAPLAYNFWNEENMESVKDEASEVNFHWLSVNYAQLYANYLKVRTPNTYLAESNVTVKHVAEQIKRLNDSNAHTVHTLRDAPPYITDPRVGKGLTFQPNGFNKLYTKSDEIWIDGYFRQGQLKDGKVFQYDHDGVLLKVQVFKDGKYVSDGGL